MSIFFNIILNIKFSFISQNNEYCKNTKYILFGMAIHLGQTLRRGHYYSIIRRDNKWYQFDDNKIKELKLEINQKNGYILFDKIDKEIIFRNGYLLFYRKINSL
jgi:ubiquitin C-terminal hydrolase